MTEQAAAARRAYKREWARNNRDKVKAQQERYWTRKAAEGQEHDLLGDIGKCETEKAVESIGNARF